MLLRGHVFTVDLLSLRWKNSYLPNIAYERVIVPQTKYDVDYD